MHVWVTSWARPDRFPHHPQHTSHRPPPRLAGVFLLFTSIADSRLFLFQVHWKPLGVPVGSPAPRSDSAQLAPSFSGDFPARLSGSPLNGESLRSRKACHRSSRKTKEKRCNNSNNRRISGRSFANSCKMAQAAQLDRRGERDGASQAKERARHPQKRVTHLCNEASTGM